MKKRTVSVIAGAMALSLLLSACGSTPEKQESPVQSVDFNAITETTTTEKTETVETEPVEEVQEEVVEEESREGMYRSELTNEWIDEALKNQRPIAVMIDNEKTALPHYGLTEADIVYEMVNSLQNNRITRFMAIVKDWEKIEQLGSIRSTRPTNCILAIEWNAILCHDGGPFYINDWLAREDSANFNGGFSRVENGKAREFTEYILKGDLEKKFKNYNYSTEYNEFYKGDHFVFSNQDFNLSDTHSKTKDAKTIELPFPHNESTLKYNSDNGTYDYYEYGSAHVDPQHNNAVLTFENVILQNVTFAKLDDHGYLIYNIIGSGDGYYINDGKVVEIEWIKENSKAETVYKDKETGEQLVMKTGKTYIGIVPDDTWNEISFK